MEAVASLTTLIAFSLQSTKFVYQTIDDIQDGPSVITSLVESTKRLEGILQQFLQLINHTSQSQQAQNLTAWKPLQQKVSECTKDMQEASDKLKILNPNDAKQQVDKVWKRVKLSLKDKFFARLDGQIKGHLAELALQLQILNRYVAIVAILYLCAECRTETKKSRNHLICLIINYPLSHPRECHISSWLICPTVQVIPTFQEMLVRLSDISVSKPRFVPSTMS